MTTPPPIAGATGRLSSRGRAPGAGRVTPYVFVAPFSVLFVVFLVAPLIMAVYSSFFTVKRSGLGFGGAGPTTSFAGLSNYVTALTDQGFLEGFGRVLLFGVVQVPVMLGLSLFFALLIDSTLVRFKKLFQLVVFLPYAVPGVVAALMWGFLYQPGVSPLVQGLRGIGIPADFLAPGTVLWSIANVTTWSYVGVNMVVMFAALQAIPDDIYEAARIDGASELRIALAIKAPLILPTILLTCLLSIIGTLQLFNEPQVLRSITANVSSDYTPNMAILNVTTGQNDVNLGSAMAVVLGLVTFILSLVVSRFQRKNGAQS